MAIFQLDLKCSGCSRKFQLGVDSAVVVLEVAIRFHPELSAMIQRQFEFNSEFGLTQPQGGSKGIPDQVDYREPIAYGRFSEEDEESLTYVWHARKGKGLLKGIRYWKCKPCGKVQRYPFF